MYVQITTRCNMSCKHCGMNCNSQGEDMSFETFKQALQHDDTITIGGGEPTIHPEFEKFLFYALAHCYSIFVITNGKVTDKALALAKLNEMTDDHYSFGAELSQDPYHEPIEDRVVKAFGKRIRDTSRHLINAGRCDWGDDDACICEELFVKPNGDVHQCGCDNSPKVGHINDERLKSINEDEGWICYRELKEIEEAA